jgi:MFS transporter, DHA2 family, multidrug resistance protein
MSAQSSTSLYGADPALLSPIAARLLKRDLLKWVIALTASLGATLEIIDTVITNVALPDIRGNLGASLSEAGWVSTSYSCANVVLIPLSAWLGYRFGKRSYFIFSLIGFTVASLLCGLSGSLGMLILARVLQGLAGGGLLAKAQSIVFEAFPPKERPVAQSIFGLGVVVGPAIGPVLGGWLTDNMGWRWIFFINIPVGIFAVGMCMLFLPEDDPSSIKRGGAVDWWGIFLLALGLASFQIMLEEGQQEGWFDSDWILTAAITSVIGIGLFIWRELTTPHPAVDLRVLRHPSMIGGTIYSAILGMGLYGIMFVIPVFAQDYLHFTALQSGEILVPGAIASAISMMLYGKIGGRILPRILITIGAIVTSLTGILLMDINPNTGSAQLFLPLILRGAGSVMIFMPLSIATLGPLPKQEIAAGSGLYSLTRQLGSSIGIALITTLLARHEFTHRAELAAKITDFRPAVLERLGAYTQGVMPHHEGPAIATQQAYGLLERVVLGQAALLSYADIYFFVACLFLFSLPVILLLGNKRSADADDAAASAH